MVSMIKSLKFDTFMTIFQHTIPGVAVLLESLFHYHRYPSRKVGLSIVLTISAAYTAW